ncbi:MAG: DsbA family oxidoreductase [Pseudomonadaceae bacterium]|nr:DsbA family oxidoreductase [Pseudomonadaceae bacterium]
MLIEIFSDIICPWCFIGKRRLDVVLAGPTGDGVSVRWRPWQLQPNVPAQGIDRMKQLRSRYGEGASLARVPGRIREEASSVGLELNYAAITKTPNTAAAHALMDVAHDQGLQHELAEQLFRAHFLDGLDVGDEMALMEIARASGLSEPDVSQCLSGPGREQADREMSVQRERAMELNIAGVPSFLLANSYVLPGAQTVDSLAQIIERAKSRLDDRPA